MIPTEEEKQRIQEAQLVNPDIPLGSAEQFLLILSSITELSARLQLWAFKMDYELTEKVIHMTLSHFDYIQRDRSCSVSNTSVPGDARHEQVIFSLIAHHCSSRKWPSLCRT